MAEDISRATSPRILRTALASALVMIMMITSPPQANAQTTEGTVRIAPAITSVDVDHGPFVVSVVVENFAHFGLVQYDDDRDTKPDRAVESNGLGAFEFTIEYDPAALTVLDAEEGTELERTGRDFQCLPPAEEPGSFSFACLSLGPEPPGPQGTMTLATVTLQPAGAGSTFLLLEADLVGPLGSDAAPVEVRAGAVRVTGRPDPTATPLPPASTATPPPAPTSFPTGTPTATETTPPTPTATEEPQTPTVAAPATSVVGNSSGPGDEPGGSVADGPSPGALALWSLAALASVVAAATLGLAAIRWRRRHRLGV